MKISQQLLQIISLYFPLTSPGNTLRSRHEYYHHPHDTWGNWCSQVYVIFKVTCYLNCSFFLPNCMRNQGRIWCPPWRVPVDFFEINFEKPGRGEKERGRRNIKLHSQHWTLLQIFRSNFAQACSAAAKIQLIEFPTWVGPNIRNTQSLLLSLLNNP